MNNPTLNASVKEGSLAFNDMVQKAFEVITLGEFHMTTIVKKERHKELLRTLNSYSYSELEAIVGKKFKELTILSGLTRTRLLNILSENCPEIKCIDEDGDAFRFAVPSHYMISWLQWKTFCAANKLRFVSLK